MKSLLKLVLAFVVLWLFWLLPARSLYAQERLVYTGTIGLQPTDWAGVMNFPRFDPTIGILTGIEFVLDGRLEGNASFESLDAQAVTVTVGMSADVLLRRPIGEQILQARPAESVAERVAPFDGEVDFGGKSGRVFPRLIGVDIVESETLSNSADLALFTGEGLIDLPVVAMGRAAGQGGGNLALSYNTSAAAFVTVTYRYAGAAIDLEKLTNDEDADEAPGVLLNPGDPVTWTYIITNTGAVDLTGLSVLDDQEGTITCPDTNLAAGATMVCTLVSSGAQPLQYTNVATVTATTVDDGVNLPRTISDSDPSNYYASDLDACPLDNQGQVELPRIIYLGPGPGTFILPDGYETFIVKRRATVGLPFKFDLDPGVTNAEGQQVLVIDRWPQGARQRVWACAGDCNFVAHLDGPVELGFLDAGLSVGAVVIDDDSDDRINKWIANANGVITDYPIDVQEMVEYLTLEVPQSAMWSYYAVDSVGIVHLCLTTPKALFAQNANNGSEAAMDESASDPVLFLPAVFGDR
jgi:hypothetical protein